MNFSDVETFVHDGYVALGYDANSATFPVLDPGPATDANLQKLSPGRVIFLTLGGGAGVTSEDLFDRPFITCRVIGDQGDYADAETLAQQLDHMFLAVNQVANRQIGTARVLYVARAGGGPVLLEKDSADRYHFTVTYITETGTGL